MHSFVSFERLEGACLRSKCGLQHPYLAGDTTGINICTVFPFCLLITVGTYGVHPQARLPVGRASEDIRVTILQRMLSWGAC